MARKILYLSGAFGFLIALFLLIAWDLPASGDCGSRRQPYRAEYKSDDAQKNCATIGFVIGTRLANAWDFAEHHHVFEFLIAAFTALLAFFTFTLWLATRGLLKHAPAVERGYMSGGGHRDNSTTVMVNAQGHVVGQRTEETGQFLFRVNNYGKTPAKLRVIGFGFCEEGEVPDEPQYAYRYFDSWIGPQTNGLPMHREPIPEELQTPACYGRFYFETIFNEIFSAGFLYRIPRGREPESLRPPSRLYTDLRREQQLPDEPENEESARGH